MKNGANQYRGLNVDKAYDSPDYNQFYIDAVNLRITTTSGESQSSVTNFKGNKYYFEIPQEGASGVKEIIGTAYIRNEIILFTADDAGTGGWIYKLEYDEVTGDVVPSSPTLVYSDPALNFNKNHPIEALGRYESDCIKRVYWTDYNNYFRSINIEDAALSTTPVGLIDIFPNVTYTQPLITAIFGGGALKVGSYEYAYRLITFDGKESLISPPSKMIHITQDLESLNQSAKYTGNQEGVNSNKSVQITIDTTNYTIFETIELIAIFHSDYTGTPEVTSVETIAINSLNSITFVHTGDEESASDLELFEYASKQYPFKTFKTLTSKDNSLIPANIKGSDFDAQQLLSDLGETFDGRTRRARYDGTDLILPNTETSDSDVLQNQFNTAFNADRHWEELWHRSDVDPTDPTKIGSQYKYRPALPTETGITYRLGGQSKDYVVNPNQPYPTVSTMPSTVASITPNVSYHFHLEPFDVDSSNGADFNNVGNYQMHNPDLLDGYGNYINASFDSQASPFRSGLTRGYKRGETYRFGIIFYNKKGEASFVEPIGDIKFPDISDEDTLPTIIDGTIEKNYFPLSRETFRDPSSTVTTAYALGIKFTLNFDTCPNFINNYISGYQIVRVKRTNTDSRRLCSGIMKTFMNFPIEARLPSQPAPNVSNPTYDLRFGTIDAGLHLFPFQRYWGKNSNFCTLNNELSDGHANNTTNWATVGQNVTNGTPDPGNQGYEWDIYGAFLTYYSPDISFNWGQGIRDNLMWEQGACLLMTGRYAQYYSHIGGSNSSEPPSGTPLVNEQPYYEQQTAYQAFCASNAELYADRNSYLLVNIEGDYFYDSDGYENCGYDVRDERRKLRTVGQVNKGFYPVGSPGDGSYRGVEYVKQWDSKQFVNFDSFNTIIDSHTAAELGVANGPFEGEVALGPSTASLHVRNFYASLFTNDISLNDHETSGWRRPTTWYKGATGITGSMRKIEVDPILNTPVSQVPGTDYFATVFNPANVATTRWEKVAPIPDTDLYYTGYGGAGPIYQEQNTDQAAAKSTPIIDILIPRAEIYGGYSQDALENNVYYPISTAIEPTNLTPIVFGGDIFLNMWVFQEGSCYLADKFYQQANDQSRFDTNISSTMSFVTESRTNTDLSFGAVAGKTGVKYDMQGGPTGQLKEVWRQETKNAESTYGLLHSGYSTYNMYLASYNGAYSAESDQVAFFIRPDDFEKGCNSNDIRAFISDVKTNEETLDSWTKFGINNYYDVDDYGPINKVVNYKDEVYFIQDKGVGQYSINPRAIVSAEDGIPTELGSGEGFRDHKYITTEYGSIHQWAVKESDSGIYFYDSIHKKIFKIGQGKDSGSVNAPLSEIKGMHSFLNNMEGDIALRKPNDGDNPILNKGVHIVRDKRNDEILFTFLGTNKCRTLEGNTVYTQGDIVCVPNSDPDVPILYYEVITTYTSLDGNEPIDLLEELLLHAIIAKGDLTKSKYTLVFDELMGEFSSFYSGTPPIYIENGDLLLSPDPSNREKIYKHNDGNFGEFYGTVEEASIKLVLNAQADINKILRFIEFNSIVRDRNKNIDRTQTITGFRIETEYQDTGKMTVDSGRIKRKFDKWRLKIPRDKLNGGTDRLRSTHFILTLYFDNTYNKELILNKIISFFDIQMY